MLCLVPPGQRQLPGLAPGHPPLPTLPAAPSRPPLPPPRPHTPDLQLNIANPSNGAMKIFEVDDEKKLVQFYEKRMAQEVQGDFLGDQFKGYVFRCVALATWAGLADWLHWVLLPLLLHPVRARVAVPWPLVVPNTFLTPPSRPLPLSLPPPPPLRITGGNDKQGFPMAQGILTNSRVRLLMAKGAVHYRPRRAGERKRKSVRGCIVGPDLATLNLVIAKKGEADIPGLTLPGTKTSEPAGDDRPRRLGPKRAQKIRKLFRLSKEDDVRKYVVTRTYNSRKGEKKEHKKRPKIQRLVTSLTLQHKRQRIAEKKETIERQKKDKSAYKAILTTRTKEARAARASLKAKRLSSRRSSKKEAA